mgnify:CR=1 FL=1
MKRLISIIAAIVLPLMAIAQPDVKVKAPNLVGINEQFRISFEISGDDSPSDFSWNAGDDFQVVWGPQKGTSRSITSVNGKRTETSSTSFTYILLPKKAGKFQLDAAIFTVKGKKYTTDRPNIEVVQDSEAGQQQVPDQPRSQQDMVSDDDIFMRLTLSKRNVILGEPVTATLKIYQRVNIAGFENARFPDFNGFWSQETNAPTNIEFQRENINDKIYNAALIRTWTLIPQQAGEIRIDPAELVCLINIRSQRAPTGSIFDSFFQDDYQTIRKRISTPAVTVKVSQLPAGAPASFGGGVGNYKMDVALTRDSLMTHDAASLIVTVTGSGNVALLEAPKVNFPPDFEVYDAKTKDIPGGKSFEYPFIPRSHGDFVLDPVKYSYYDVSAGRYVTLTGDALEIKVAKGNSDAAPVQSGQVVSSNRKDVKTIGTDIRFISSSAPRLLRKAHFFAGSTAYWLIAAALSAMAAAIYFALRAGAKRRADVAGTKNRTATKMARKRLSQAGIFLKKGLHTAFYEELHKTVLGFVSDKLNMDISEMSKENIAARLKDNGVGDALAAEYLELLDSCEFARYAPDAGNEAMNTDYEKAVEVISAMDGAMGRKRKGNSASTAAVVAVMVLSAHSVSVSAAVDVQADSLWNAGVEAYADGRWQDARQAWSGIEALGLESKELYYNIGNACFKQDDPAHAILYFERALRLDPSYDDARFNLEYANSMIQDKIESVPEFFLISWTRSLSMICPADTWAVLSLVLFAICLAMVLIFLLGHSAGLRKTGFGVAIASLLLTLLCFSMASMQKKQYHKEDMAIVVSAVSPVKSSPGNETSRDLFVLHEGTKLKILDEVGQWKNVELSDGRQGWVLSSNLEII